MNLDTKRIRMEAQARGLTQKRIAELTRLSYESVNHVFRGLSCSERTALLIAQALSLPLYEIESRG